MKEPKPKRKKVYNEKTVWDAFSKYIRLRDANEHGICKCFTCSRRAFWKDMDCGHGHGRQALPIKYHLWNNHAQCGHCNLDGGRQDMYKSAVNALYGANAWDILEALKRTRTKRFSAFECEHLTIYWTQEFDKFKTIKTWQR